MPFDIPFIRPRFPASDLIAADYDAIVASNWFSNFGPKEREFASMISEFVGQDVHAVTTANATIGLMALLHSALGHGDGSRHIIVPSFTFAAGPEAIEWCGFRPLFIDIDAETLQPSLTSARSAVAGFDVAGVLLCNSFGIGNPEIGAWATWAESADLPLLIDSAAGFGSRYGDGLRLGAAGAAEVFSFHATKPFAIGEGGAIVTRDDELAARLKAFQNFGFGGDRQVASLGLNGKLSELSAAIGIRQFEDFDASLLRRQATLDGYRRRLDASWHMPEGAGASSVCFATAVAPDAAAADAAYDRLIAGGVEARRYYQPVVHHQTHFASAPRAGELAVTEDIASRILSLPVHDGVGETQLDLIARLIDPSVDR